MTKSEKLQSLKDLTNENLLRLYHDYVCNAHYNEGYDPAYLVEFLRLKIEVKDIEELVLERMLPDNQQYVRQAKTL
jgi:hypothetical protein